MGSKSSRGLYDLHKGEIPANMRAMGLFGFDTATSRSAVQAVHCFVIIAAVYSEYAAFWWWIVAGCERRQAKW